MIIYTVKGPLKKVCNVAEKRRMIAVGYSHHAIAPGQRSCPSQETVVRNVAELGNEQT